MPLARDIQVLFESEYDRFMRGLTGLTPEGQAEARAKAILAGQQADDPKVIRIPRVDDIIHIAPRIPITPEERRAHFAALRRGEHSPLSQAKQDELARRKTVATAIRDAAQPEYAQAFGQILTAIDNVQDFFSTVSTVGRLAFWSAKWLAPKTVARLVPGIGWVLLASDLLNLLGFFGQLALPMYALLCRQPSEVLAAALPAAIFGRALKSEVWSLANLNPFSRKARLARRLRSMPGLPRISNLIEVAQTTDQLWGRGLSFGGIVGFVMNGAYGIERRLRGEPVVVKSLQSERLIHSLLHGKLALLSNAEIQDRQRAAQVLLYAPFFWRVPEAWNEQFLAQLSIAVLGAVDLIEQDIRGTGWQAFVTAEPVNRFSPPEPPPANFSGVRDELEPPGQDFSGWPIPGYPPFVTFEDWDRLGEEDLPQALARFLAPRRNNLTGMFFGALVDAMIHRLWLLLEEDDHLFHFELTPQWRVLASLAESNRLVNIGDDERDIWQFWQKAESLHQEVGDGPKTGEEWDELARAHGLTLIRLRAP